MTVDIGNIPSKYQFPTIPACSGKLLTNVSKSTKSLSCIFKNLLNLFEFYIILTNFSSFQTAQRARVGGGPWDDSFQTAQRARVGGGLWDDSFQTA